MFFTLIAVGFASIIVQILLLRELVTVFNGNELTYGISLMIWLAATGLGSYITGKMIKRSKDPLKTLFRGWWLIALRRLDALATLHVPETGASRMIL